MISALSTQYLKKCATPLKKLSCYTNNSYTMSKRCISFHVDPPTALVDDKTKYCIEGLGSGQKVTLTAVLTEGKGTYISHAHYMADSGGLIDLTTHTSLAGSYIGKEPMGLLWSMKPEKGAPRGIRLQKRDPTEPFLVNFSVLDGHQNIEASCDLEQHTVLCSVMQPRSYCSPGVRRLDIREGRLRGALYLPSGDGPFPGVIDLFGTAGGLIEFRSALLASRGFASLALAFFGYDDLPKTMSWDMEYFEEAVDFMTSHPDIRHSGIGVVGVSKGTELVNYMAIYSPLVKAVVLINPYHYYSYAKHFKNGIEQPTSVPDPAQLVQGDEGVVIDEAFWNTELIPGSLIEIEKADGAEFLFINGTDDRMAKNEHTNLLIDRLKQAGKQNYKLLRYEHAGHLIEPPYTPLTRACYHKLIDQQMLFGGHTVAHAQAQEDSWTEMLALFKRRLTNENMSKL